MLGRRPEDEGSSMIPGKRLVFVTATLTALLGAGVGCGSGGGGGGGGVTRTPTPTVTPNASPTATAQPTRTVTPTPNPIGQACLDAGGTVSSGLCCASVADYPNTCSVGSCGCAPAGSHTVQLCECGAGRCFDGTTCVSR
jgi:hypothetical protein